MSLFMKNTLLLAVLLTAATFTALPVKAETKKIEFEGPVRLQQALSTMEEQGLLRNAYWPTARLVKADEQSELNGQKQRIQAELKELADYWRSRRETDKAGAAERLRAQISTWQLGKQYWGALSLEQARLELAGNPLLPEGDYELVISERPNFVYAYGLVNEPGQYQFHSGKTLANWLQSIDDK
ncbi:MAG: capsule biosynthesis GfcC family protein, partial [Alteromonadaceae bacterium]|nr:capsule biosynthesis GfcC family protein [Alteromonadaceae bacterium]